MPGKYPAAKPPLVWRETHDLGRFDKDPLYQEPFNRKMWPKNGFIDDFIAHTYGRETTNFFAFWTAVSGISGIIQRDAFLRFGEEGLFANFFNILVAEPAIAHKSTAMSLFNRIEKKMFTNMENEELYAKKKNLVIRGKATAEAIFDAMSNRPYTKQDGEEGQTNANFIGKISELTTLLSKAQYNAQLIDKITDFYDCKDHDTDFTRGGNSSGQGGQRELHNIFASLFGCTTPDALKNSIPPEAFGGGFMSRCIIARQAPEDIHRIIPIPFIPPDCPDSEEMAARLLWLANNKQGEFALSEEAYDFYKEWYTKETLELRGKAIRGETDHRDNRKTLHILKLAFLCRLQAYDRSRLVSLDDLQTAIAIYEFTNEQATNTVEDIYLEGQKDGRFYKLRSIIRKAGLKGIQRRELSRKHHFKKDELDKFFDELNERGEIAIVTKPIEGEMTPSGKAKSAKFMVWQG